METKLVSEILVNLNCLIHLSAQENFIEFDCCESFKTQKYVNDAEKCAVHVYFSQWFFHITECLGFGVSTS
jgi:hypothetical protein